MFNFILSIAGLLAVLLIAHIVASYQFNQFSAGLIQQVERNVEPTDVGRTPSTTQSLPAAILKFVKRSGIENAPITTTIHLTQQSEMRLEKGGEWQELVAQQVIATDKVEFLWLAEQKMGFLTKFKVIDAFVGGKGRLNVRLFGSIPFANNTGLETDKAEAMRYLAELVWAPEAMIRNKNLTWQEHGNGDVSVSTILPHAVAKVRFTFDEQGDIIEVSAKDRPAEIVDGKPITRDWLIKIGDYKQFGDRRIAGYGEVSYLYADGFEAYWHGHVITYQAKTL